MKYLGNNKDPSLKKLPEKMHDFAADTHLSLAPADEVTIDDIFIYEQSDIAVKLFFQVFTAQRFFYFFKLLQSA